MTIPEHEPEAYLTKEEIEMELNKIPELEKKLIRIENELIIINKRIKRLQNDNCKL